MADITDFKGKYSFLSNFYPTRIIYKGATYPSVENAYQAAKTLDIDARIPFEGCTAAQAKKLGRKLQIRSDWDKVKLDVMTELVWQKFKRPSMAAQLIDTFPSQLIEGNWWGDKYWGVCRGEGANWLGVILMKIRDQLRSGYRTEEQMLADLWDAQNPEF